jgi:hypothetical protein
MGLIHDGCGPGRPTLEKSRRFSYMYLSGH